MNGEGSSILLGASSPRGRSIGNPAYSRARTGGLWVLLGTGLKSESPVDIFEYIRRADIQGIT